MPEIEKDVKEFIITVASHVFARYGYTKTTMHDIATAAKKAKSSLYHYFPSKENVFQAILDKELSHLQNEIAQAIAHEDTPQKKLCAFILTRMLALQKLGNFYSVVRGEYLDHYGFIEKLRKRYDEEEMKVIKNILQMGIAEDVFAIQDLETTTFSIFSAIKGLEPFLIIENNPTQNKKIFDNMMNIFFYGINKR
jgi:AcrR family transcriptional regulator